MRAAALALALLWASPSFAQTSPSDFTSGARYDALRRLVGVIAPDPDDAGPLRFGATRNSYDAAGQLVKVETGHLLAWQDETIAPANWTGFVVSGWVEIGYDAMGRKVRETATTGASFTVTQYGYDGLGRLECTAVRMNPAVFGSLPASACTPGTPGVFGPDRITRNSHDAVGQLLKVQQAYGTPLQQDYATYTYSPNGRMTSVTDANGNKAAMSYDGHDRQARWSFPNAAGGGVSTTDYEEYGYDPNGNRTTLRKRDGRTFGFSYDALNRVTAKIVPDACPTPPTPYVCDTPPAASTRDVVYGYDLRGLQTAALFQTGDGLTNRYDSVGRVTIATTTMGGVTRTLNYAYDPNGNRTRITHPDGQQFNTGYDKRDRPVHGDVGGSGSLLEIGYDQFGRRVSSARGGSGLTYGYDNAGRLTGLAVDLAGGSYDQTTSFTYNPASQIATRTRSNPAQYAFTGYAALNQGYAVNGLNQYVNVGGVSVPYDANGNLRSDGGTAYVYDAENRLVSATGLKNAALVYDPAGRLFSISSGGATVQFLYDGDDMIAEYDGSGAMLRRYYHGPGADEAVTWFEGGSTAAIYRRALVPDERGSIVAIADASGNVLTINSYDEYGVPGAGNDGRFQYTGQAWLPSLGLYYYKARMYSSRLGRFLQTDPIGYDGGINLYAYADSDPVNSSDPSGTCPRCPPRYYMNVTYSHSPTYRANLARAQEVLGEQPHNWLRKQGPAYIRNASGAGRPEAQIASARIRALQVVGPRVMNPSTNLPSAARYGANDIPGQNVVRLNQAFLAMEYRPVSSGEPQFFSRAFSGAEGRDAQFQYIAGRFRKDNRATLDLGGGMRAEITSYASSKGPPTIGIKIEQDVMRTGSRLTEPVTVFSAKLRY